MGNHQQQPIASDPLNSFIDLLAERVAQKIQQQTRAEKIISERLLTPPELAEHLQVPISWVYDQSRVGAIPTVRVGRYLRFHLGEVLGYLQAQKRSR